MARKGNGMEATPTLRKAEPADMADCLALWERSVRASHHFLTEQDIVDIRAEATQAMPMLESVVAEVDGRLAGFMAMHGSMVEALFIDPDFKGKGIGSRLLDHARQSVPAGTPVMVDVNEQNPAALSFYLSRGFRQIGRSPTDSAGRPFPLLHLQHG